MNDFILNSSNALLPFRSDNIKNGLILIVNASWLVMTQYESNVLRGIFYLQNNLQVRNNMLRGSSVKLFRKSRYLHKLIIKII